MLTAVGYSWALTEHWVMLGICALPPFLFDFEKTTHVSHMAEQQSQRMIWL